MHPDFKSHIGASMFLGENPRGIQNFFKEAAKSSVVAELIGQVYSWKRKVIMWIAILFMKMSRAQSC